MTIVLVIDQSLLSEFRMVKMVELMGENHCAIMCQATKLRHQEPRWRLTWIQKMTLKQ